MARRTGGDKLFQKEKELNKKDFKRQKNNKQKVPDIIIACEDSVSAPTYFKLIVQRLLDDKLITADSFVIAIPHNTHPSGVLEDLKNHKTSNGKKYSDFTHKWIVIDRDVERANGGGHTKKDFNLALEKAKKIKVEVAYCNDSFELWYLLHFVYRDTTILRDEILDEVIKKLKVKNQHKFAHLNSSNIKEVNYIKLIYAELTELQETAINNAKKLLASYGGEHNPESDNPLTTVYLLVELLNKLVISSIYNKQ